MIFNGQPHAFHQDRLVQLQHNFRRLFVVVKLLCVHSIVWMESSNCLQMVHQKNALLGALCIFVTKLGNLVFFLGNCWEELDIVTSNVFISIWLVL